MKTKSIRVCEAIEVELRVKYPYNHPQRNTIGYSFVINPDHKDKLIEFIKECVKLNGGEAWNIWEGKKEDYPVKNLKQYWEIRDTIFSELEEVIDKVEELWKEINKKK